MSWILILLALALALFAIYKWFTKNFNYFKKRNVAFINKFSIDVNNIGEYVQFLYNQLAGEK